MLEVFNEKAKKNIKKRQIQTILPILSEISPSSNDAWFSGFTDAEGCFTVSFLRGSPTYRIRFIISQNGRENLPIFSFFVLLFKIGKIEMHHKKNHFYFIISGNQNCLAIYSYFQDFCLKTKKAQSLLLWKQIHESIQKKEHLNPLILPQLINKAKKINQKDSAT